MEYDVFVHHSKTDTQTAQSTDRSSDVVKQREAEAAVPGLLAGKDRQHGREGDILEADSMMSFGSDSSLFSTSNQSGKHGGGHEQHSFSYEV